MWADHMMMAPGWRRMYVGSEMAGVLHGEGISPETIKAFLTSTPSPNCFGGPGPMMNLEAAVCRSATPDRRPLLPHPAAPYTADPSTRMVLNDVSDLDDYCGFVLPQQQEHPHSNASDPKKRRLSSEQVQFLESSFESEKKLEPDRKAEIARSLGLQPRQVAIWFQNRRARWRTKQLERDYEAMMAGYEGLKREYEVTRKEKEKLEAEVNCLREQLLHRQQKRRGGSGTPEIETRRRRLQGSFIPKMGYEAGACALRKREDMFRRPHQEPAETDQLSELDHAEEQDLEGVVAAARRYEFPDEHHPPSLWPWHPAEFCGP